MSDQNTMDEFRNNVVKPELFRGKQTVREMLRTIQEENQRQFEMIKRELEEIKRSL